MATSVRGGKGITGFTGGAYGTMAGKSNKPINTKSPTAVRGGQGITAFTGGKYGEFAGKTNKPISNVIRTVTALKPTPVKAAPVKVTPVRTAPVMSGPASTIGSKMSLTAYQRQQRNAALKNAVAGPMRSGSTSTSSRSSSTGASRSAAAGGMGRTGYNSKGDVGPKR